MRKPIKWFKRWFGSLTNRQRESLTGYAFISIWLVGFIFLTMVPLFESFIYSFQRITIVGGEGIRLTFVGFQNYKASS